jgi:hypothetical protein
MAGVFIERFALARAAALGSSNRKVRKSSKAGTPFCAFLAVVLGL